MTAGRYLMRAICIVLLMFNTSVIAQDAATFPAWLVKKLDIYRQSSPGTNAFATEYQGKKAYYIPARCCDIPSELYDEAGVLICYPSGGFLGGDGKCPSFKRN